MKKQGLSQKRIITEEIIHRYVKRMEDMERAQATIKKVASDLEALMDYAGGEPLDAEKMIAYKQHLLGNGYKESSINTYISSINSFVEYQGWVDLKIKPIRVQKEMYYPERKNLTREEYEKLVKTARALGKYRLAAVITTLCTLSLRVSELQFLDVAAVKMGVFVVKNKGKSRSVMLTEELQKELLAYIEKNHITSGPVFCTRTGKPLHRTNIWREMKKLGKTAGIPAEKIFPHNLRHLFARIHYEVHKDIVMLADILGHSSIETTRIYTLKTQAEYQKQLMALHLELPLVS